MGSSRCADLLDQGLVVQDKAQPQGAVEPIRALFQRPAGAVGAQAVAADPRALPGVVIDGVVFVEVPGDALAGRHGPIAEPARRLDAPQRKRQEGRLDLRLAGACVIGRRFRCGRRKVGRAAGRRNPEYQAQQRAEMGHSTDHRLSPSKGGKSRWDARRAANIWIVHWAQAGRKSLARFFTGPQSRYGDWSIFRPSGVAPANESLAENMGLSPLAARGGQSHLGPWGDHGYARYRQNQKWCILSASSAGIPHRFRKGETDERIRRSLRPAVSRRPPDRAEGGPHHDRRRAAAGQRPADRRHSPRHRNPFEEGRGRSGVPGVVAPPARGRRSPSAWSWSQPRR